MKLRETNLPVRGLVVVLAVLMAAAMTLLPGSASAASVLKKTAYFDSSAAKSNCRLTVHSVDPAAGASISVRAIARSRAFPGFSNNRTTTVHCAVYDASFTLLGVYTSDGGFYVNETQTAVVGASTTYYVCGQSVVDLRYGDDVVSPVGCA